MSRSFRKYPFYDGGSKRWGKKYASRLLRHKTKEKMETITVDILWRDQDGFHAEPRREGCPAEVRIVDLLLPKADEVYDFWWNNDSGCEFDPEKYPHLLRK